MYNAWKMKNKRRDDKQTDPNAPQRAPQDIIQIAEQTGKGGPPPLPQRTVSIIEDQKQRYFKIPFIRPSDQSKCCCYCCCCCLYLFSRQERLSKEGMVVGSF